VAKDGPAAMARYIAKVHTDNTHFLYARERRSPAEQTKVGRLMWNLFLFRRAALEKAALQLRKAFERGTGFGAKRRAAWVFATLITSSALVGLLWRKITGQTYDSYSFINFLEINTGGLELAAVKNLEEVINNMLRAASGDEGAIGKLTTSIPKSADYMIPFYDLGTRFVEATLDAKNLDRKALRKIRMMIDKEYKIREGAYHVDRSLIEKLQYTFGGAGIDKQIGERKKTETETLILK